MFLTTSEIIGIPFFYFINLDGVNSLYFVFNDVDACFECIDESKYLVFALTDENGEALENYKELWSEIKE